MSLRTVASCNNCRSWVLRTFITSIGGSALQVQQRRAFTSPVTPPKSHEGEDALSSISSEPHQDALHPSPSNHSADTTESPSTSSELDQFSTSQPSQPSVTSHLPQSSIPWYLQSQSQTTPIQSQLSTRQQLPELPSHSPPLLHPLLTHISLALGLDDLTLLDLRTMDPPPALGSSLLMILGTTRSEKHLHVSADRLCRWLRTEHNLSPYADGLLGRNELKLKMRRLTKKRNLLSAVGAMPNDTSGKSADEVDDGIRTGWVCVNIGTVEGGELPKTPEQIAREEGIVGFNTQTAGCKIVVQMMTEEKREVLGLERLWTGILKRNVKERNEVLGLEEEEPVAEVLKVTEKRERVVKAEPVVEAEVARVPDTQPATTTTTAAAAAASESDAPARPTTTYIPFEVGQYSGRGKKDRRFTVERV